MGRRTARLRRQRCHAVPHSAACTCGHTCGAQQENKAAPRREPQIKFPLVAPPCHAWQAALAAHVIFGSLPAAQQRPTMHPQTIYWCCQAGTASIRQPPPHSAQGTSSSTHLGAGSRGRPAPRSGWPGAPHGPGPGWKSLPWRSPHMCMHAGGGAPSPRSSPSASITPRHQRPTSWVVGSSSRGPAWRRAGHGGQGTSARYGARGRSCHLPAWQAEKGWCGSQRALGLRAGMGQRRSRSCSWWLLLSFQLWLLGPAGWQLSSQSSCRPPCPSHHQAEHLLPPSPPHPQAQRAGAPVATWRSPPQAHMQRPLTVAGHVWRINAEVLAQRPSQRPQRVRPCQVAAVPHHQQRPVLLARHCDMRLPKGGGAHHELMGGEGQSSQCAGVKLIDLSLPLPAAVQLASLPRHGGWDTTMHSVCCRMLWGCGPAGAQGCSTAAAARQRRPAGSQGGDTAAGPSPRLPGSEGSAASTAPGQVRRTRGAREPPGGKGRGQSVGGWHWALESPPAGFVATAGPQGNSTNEVGQCGNAQRRVPATSACCHDSWQPPMLIAWVYCPLGRLNTRAVLKPRSPAPPPARRPPAAGLPPACRQPAARQHGCRRPAARPLPAATPTHYDHEPQPLPSHSTRLKLRN